MLTLPADSPLHDAAKHFPFQPLPNGGCPQLLPDNRCAVYDARPLLCDVDRMYSALAPTGLTLNDWHALNAAACPPPTLNS